MRHALRTLVISAALVAAGVISGPALAQEEDEDRTQGPNRGQVGGLIADVGGEDNVYHSAAGASGEVDINRDPGVTSANNADGQGNRTATRDERRAAREAERAAAAEAAPAAPAAPEPVAAEPAPAPAADAAAPAAAPAAGGRAVTALPSTGTGVAGQTSAALALVLAGLAAGAFLIVRRAQRA